MCLQLYDKPVQILHIWGSEPKRRHVQLAVQTFFPCTSCFLLTYWHILNYRYNLFINSSVMVLCDEAATHWSVSPLDSHSDHHFCVCSESSRCWWFCWCAAVLKRNRMMWELPWRLLFHCDSEDNHRLCNWTDLLTICSCWPSHINFLPLCPQGNK